MRETRKKSQARKRLRKYDYFGEATPAITAFARATTSGEAR
jgi:hypothetical protein